MLRKEALHILAAALRNSVVMSMVLIAGWVVTFGYFAPGVGSTGVVEGSGSIALDVCACYFMAESKP